MATVGFSNSNRNTNIQVTGSPDRLQPTESMNSILEENVMTEQEPGKRHANDLKRKIKEMYCY